MNEFIVDWDRLSDSLREPFIGVVAHAKWNCDCVICQKSPIKVDNRLHVGIVALDKAIDCQSAWFNYSAKKWSSWGAFCLAMKRIGLSVGVSSLQELLEKLKRTILQFESISVVKFIERETGLKAPNKLPESLVKKETWIPVRVVKLKELEFTLRDDFRDKLSKVTIDSITQIAEEAWKDHLRKHESVEEVSTVEYDMTGY